MPATRSVRRSDPAGDRWPFERAQLQLDYGEWLRRQRRINDAKPVLEAAPCEARALDGLTAQQREIVILADRSLTNGEIADRLFLSPRTVASHLYRSYPSWVSPAGTSSVISSTGRHPADQQLGRMANRHARFAGPPWSRTITALVDFVGQLLPQAEFAESFVHGVGQNIVLVAGQGHETREEGLQLHGSRLPGEAEVPKPQVGD